MTHNWGGIVLQTGLARLWVDALCPDVLCWHELWDIGSARAAIPPSYEALWGTADGAGTGFVIAWKKSLRRRPDDATLAFDGDHWIAALLPLWHVGRLLVLNVHFHPKITYREWMQQVRRMEQLRRDLQPDYSFLSGDFNATDAPNTPLASALSPSGALHNYLRVLPTGTPTNHTIVEGARRATAIDHVFIHGPVAEARQQLLPSRSSHAVIVVTVTLLTASADTWAWRRFRWRRASPLELDILGAALDLVWGWLSLTPALPDDYVASHHEIAAQLVPRPPDTRQGLLLNPQGAANDISSQSSIAEYSRHFPPPDPTWSSSHLIEAIDNASLEPRAVHVIMLHRLLSSQRHPTGYGGVVCPYCHLAQTDVADHLLRRCPPFFLQYLTLAWRVLRHPSVFPLVAASSGTSRLLHGTFLSIPTLLVGLTWEVLPAPLAPSPNSLPSQLLLSLSGSWRVASPDPRRPPLLSAQRALVTADHHVALAQPPPALRHALEAVPTLWEPAPTPLPALVRVQHTSSTLGLHDSVVLGWLLRRCRSWRLCTGATPCIPLPPASPPQSTTAWVVSALGCTQQECIQMASLAPDDSHLVLLTRTADLLDLQARIQEPLMRHDLPNGLTVGRASGAPLNVHDWPE